MKRNQLILTIAILSLSSHAFAADATYSPPSVTTRTLCSKMVVGSNATITNTPVNQILGSTFDCIPIAGGGVGWGGIPPFVVAIGGNFAPDCPTDHPYLASISEGWGGSFVVVGGGGMTNTCCSIPVDTTMSFTTGYKTDTSGTVVYDTWADGTDCP